LAVLAEPAVLEVKVVLVVILKTGRTETLVGSVVTVEMETKVEMAALVLVSSITSLYHRSMGFWTTALAEMVVTVEMEVAEVMVEMMRAHPRGVKTPVRGAKVEQV
jgi:uncharacterized protein YigA (DUF484 family)